MGNNRAKVAKSHYPDYLRATATTLSQVYGKYSKAKANAYDYCLSLCNSLGGHDLKIISKSVYEFTVGFLFNDQETGKEMFAYITKSHNSYCEL